jgi:hypothetical protein
MKLSDVLTAAAAATVLAAAAGVSLAQPSTAEPTADRAHAGAPPGSQPGGAEAEPSNLTAPVLRISSVEIIRSAHHPVMDIIRVRGFTSSAGWEEAELVPLTRGIPADGILHLIFVARAPTTAADANGFEMVEAIMPLETDHPFKGVNVHSATDSVTVMSLPGYSEGKAPSEDCAKCVGKTLVRKGATAPSGKATAELVREEQLPPITRIIGPADGIPTADSNPNRLTIFLNKEGKITTAVWE